MLDPADEHQLSARPFITVERTDGAARLVKRSLADTSDRLVREADMLSVARHPGVVDVLEFSRNDDGATLSTAFAGSHTLETWVAPDAAQVAGLLAALAEIVADLHLIGIAHRRITADHVVLDRLGRPRLCGFAEAIEVDGAMPTARQDDVAAIGALLDAVLDRAGSSRSTRVGRPHRRAERALRVVAADARCPDGASRPSARRLASAILDAVPQARLEPLPVGVLPPLGCDPLLAPLTTGDGARERLWPPRGANDSSNGRTDRATCIRGDDTTGPAAATDRTDPADPAKPTHRNDPAQPAEATHRTDQADPPAGTDRTGLADGAPRTNPTRPTRPTRETERTERTERTDPTNGADGRDRADRTLDADQLLSTWNDRRDKDTRRLQTDVGQRIAHDDKDGINGGTRARFGEEAGDKTFPWVGPPATQAIVPADRDIERPSRRKRGRSPSTRSSSAQRAGTASTSSPSPSSEPSTASLSFRRGPRRGATLAAGLLGAVLVIVGVSTVGHNSGPTLMPDLAASATIDRETPRLTTAPAVPTQKDALPPTTIMPAGGAPPAIMLPAAAPAGSGAPATTVPDTRAPARGEPQATTLPGTAPPTGAGPAATIVPDTIAPPQTVPCAAPAACTPISLDGTVSRGGVRYAIGDPGDEIVLGDFRCRGLTSPVVLRPGSGDIFAFDAWAATGHETTAVVVARAEPDSHLVPSTIDAKGCSMLGVAAPSGRVVTIPLPPAPGA